MGSMTLQARSEGLRKETTDKADWVINNITVTCHSHDMREDVKYMFRSQQKLIILLLSRWCSAGNTKEKHFVKCARIWPTQNGRAGKEIPMVTSSTLPCMCEVTRLAKYNSFCRLGKNIHTHAKWQGLYNTKKTYARYCHQSCTWIVIFGMAFEWRTWAVRQIFTTGVTRNCEH